ncbi:E3 SUMO-protein ligase NSE2-like [Chrysoperla carnea]|uniref:E3 SUMO-protein ligase NSE2-like n=1 Tax=Chrysoperla carnea TaxID=189513 RepID=UPI001D08867F|nr:E3 SUMO-protein ligase NSE2-like [Chrysoperla carnea]
MTIIYEANSTDNAIQLIDDMFSKCINTIANNVKDPEEQNEYIKILEKTVYHCANLNVKHKHLEKVIQESKAECAEKGEININQVFQENSKSVKYENNEMQVENHQFVRKFKNKTAKLLQANEEAAAAAAPTNTPNMPLDPITQVPIVSPVKNKKCGHFYEKSSIKKMLAAAKRKGIRCPYVGCATQNYFVYDDLDENVSLSQEELNNSEVSIDETIE